MTRSRKAAGKNKDGHPPKRKEKEIEEAQQQSEDSLDRYIDEGLQAPTESEGEEEQPARQAKGKGKRIASGPQRNKKIKPTKPQLLAHLRNGITWTPTRFPDPLFLRETELYDGVLHFLQNMGLQSLITMEAQPLYEDATCQFLSSLEVYRFSEEDDQKGYGRIQFKVSGKLYKMSFKEISNIMGFNDDVNSGVPTDREIGNKVWPIIAGGDTRHAQKNKSTSIRNPIIRYVHRILGNTIYGRRESGNVLEEELCLIGLALEPVYKRAALYGEDIDVFSGFGRVGFFVKRLEYYKGWVWTNRDGTPHLNVGGLITPLLKAAGVPLGNEPKGAQAPLYMDGPYMKKTKFLAGMYEDKYVFSFNLEGHLARLVLPCPRLAKVTCRADTVFMLPYHQQLYTHAPLTNVPDRRKRTPGQTIVGASSSGTASEIHEEEDERRPPTLYGPPRYYFRPYSGVLAKGPLRDAHEYIGKLEGWNRIQDRTIYKLKAKYKDLKKTVKKNAQTSAKFIKKVGDILVNSGIGGCNTDDFVIADPSAPKPRRHKLSSDRQRRKRRNPSPDYGESENESPSMDTSEDEDECDEVGTGQIVEEEAEGDEMEEEGRDDVEEEGNDGNENVEEGEAEEDDEATASDSS